MFKRSIRLGAQFARIRGLISDFRSDKRANTAIIFAVSAIPLISAVGCVVDYSMASMVKTRLQAAADAATLAAVSNNSPLVATAKTMTGNGTVTNGATYTQNFFGSDTTGFSGVTYSATVTKTGSTVTANLTFSDQVPTMFLAVVGHPNLTVSGSSTASFTLPTYINFYLMLDVSGSMSFPSTTAEQAEADGGQSRQPAPDEQPAEWLSAGLPVRLPFHRAGSCPQTRPKARAVEGRWHGSWPSQLPSLANSSSGYPGGYCQGFIISRLGHRRAATVPC